MKPESHLRVMITCISLGLRLAKTSLSLNSGFKVARGSFRSLYVVKAGRRVIFGATIFRNKSSRQILILSLKSLIFSIAVISIVKISSSESPSMMQLTLRVPDIVQVLSWLSCRGNFDVKLKT